MKPLTKTTVNRGGGIAARFAKLAPPPEKLDAEAKKLWDSLNKNIAKKPFPKVANTDPVANKPRYARWREKNPELYKERQRAYMRRKRQKDKASSE